MNSRLVNHEPIPGYRLIERLGRGGYGEVWKAEAPGGLFKAIKFVYGDLENASEEGKPAEQELKALHRVKTIRHPYILSIERFDVVEGQLLIVMELADRNLWDRFNECRGQNLRGIPREELLSYLTETAEALDLMNQHYQIQHLDIKPQNLFLVHNHIKVADFGLAKDFEGIRATVTGGVTPVYAAPETFEGWISRFCDQYSLAIVFQELLTGVRPFSGTSARQLLMQHLSAEPDLSPLPARDKAAIRRALSKKPDERFPTCLDFIRQLTDHGPSAPSFAYGTAPAGSPGEDNGAATMPKRDHTPLPAPFQPAVPSPSGPRRPQPYHGGLPALITPTSAQAMVSTPSRSGPTPSAPITEQRRGAPQTGRLTQLGIAPPEKTGPGALFPALIIGLGGTGLAVLRRLRHSLRERFGSLSSLPHLRWLFIDTDADTIQTALSDTSPDALTPAEVMAARLQRPAYYLRREGLPPTDSWLKGEILYRIPRHPATLGLRSLGRLAFVDYYAVIAQRLRSELEVFLNDDAVAAADRATGLGFRSNRPRVYLISSLAGGTGAGMFLDLAYTVRHEMRQMGWLKPHVVGTFFLPPVERPVPKPLPIANASAALQEIYHYSQPTTRYESRFSNRDAPVVDVEPPFQRCAVLTFPRSRGARDTQRVTDLAAGHLVHEMLSPMGRVLDESRDAYQQAKPVAGVALQTFGLYRLTWPRQRLLEAAVQRFRQRLLQMWLDKTETEPFAEVANWVDDQLKRREIDPDRLLVRLEKVAEESLGGRADEVFKLPFAPADLGKLGGDVVSEAVERVIKTVGKTGQDDEVSPGTLHVAVQARAKEIAAEVERQLAEIAVHFIEQPGLRFRAAEQAIRHLETRLREVLDGLQRQYGEADRAAADDCARFSPLMAAFGSGGRSVWGDRRNASAADLNQLLRNYPIRRYRAILLRALVTIYNSLVRNAPEYLREVNFCRLQLEEFCRRLKDDGQARVSRDTTLDHAILPVDCQNIDEAAEQFIRSITREEFVEFEEHLQLQVRRQFRALVSVCIDLNEHAKQFAEVFGAEARTFLDPRLDKASPAEVFFLHRSDPQAAQREILKAFDEAAPEMPGGRWAGDAEVFVLGAPFDGPGDRFRQLTRELVTDCDLVAAQSSDDIVFYRECRAVPLSQFPQAGPLAREAIEALQESERLSPYSREDVAWLPLQRE